MDTPKTVYLCREKNVGWDYSYWNESPMGSENIAYLHADIVAERLDALRAEMFESGIGDYWIGLIDAARRDLLGDGKEASND